MSSPGEIVLLDFPYTNRAGSKVRPAIVLAVNSEPHAGDLPDALTMAWFRRQPAPGLLHHSDRGSQYASHAFQDKLREYGMTCSMSRKGNCWDNAPTESWFNSFKNERVFGERFLTREAMKATAFEYIEVFYNRRRLHSTLGYASPMQYLKNWREGDPASRESGRMSQLPWKTKNRGNLSYWPAARWLVTDKPQPHEANLLYLDSSKAHNLLDWRPAWQINQALAATAAWYQTWLECGEPISRQQITAYDEDAKQAGAAWIG